MTAPDPLPAPSPFVPCRPISKRHLHNAGSRCVAATCLYRHNSGNQNGSADGAPQVLVRNTQIKKWHFLSFHAQYSSGYPSRSARDYDNDHHRYRRADQYAPPSHRDRDARDYSGRSRTTPPPQYQPTAPTPPRQVRAQWSQGVFTLSQVFGLLRCQWGDGLSFGWATSKKNQTILAEGAIRSKIFKTVSL